MTEDDLKNLDRFTDLNFQTFKYLATDKSLSRYEKIGFPDSYREGKEDLIFKDMCNKVTNLAKSKQTVLDIGPGCSELPLMLISLCEANNHKLYLIDSSEMLDHLPEKPFIEKVAAYYPDQCDELIKDLNQKVDAMLVYSVLHYIFDEGNLYNFLDSSLRLLAEGGEMLIGDIPNVSKRKRFFSSYNGIEFHKQFMNTKDPPEITFNSLEPKCIDDSVILSIILRARLAGFDAYLLPQPINLPMANRREDILIRKP